MIKNFNFKKKIIIGMILALLIIGSSKTYAFDYPENESGYPYRNWEIGLVDEWLTFTRNCTSYVMWKINQAGKPFHNNPTGPNGKTITIGDAGTYDEHAAYIGYRVDNIPSVGNPVNWDPYSQGASAWGHVAWVERINNDGSVYVSEWNWKYGEYWERTARGDHFLHIVDECGAGNITISNKTVLPDETYTCKTNNPNSITIMPATNFQSGSNVSLFIN